MWRTTALWRFRRLPAAAILAILRAPYFFRPIDAAAAAGSRIPGLRASSPFSFAKRPPPPGRIDFFAITDPSEAAGSGPRRRPRAARLPSAGRVLEASAAATVSTDPL